MNNKFPIILLCIISFSFSDDFIIDVGKIKHEYNNIKFNYNEDNDVSIDFNIGSFLLSTTRSDFEFSDLEENMAIHLGPSNIKIKNFEVNINNHFPRNEVNFKIGSLKFDVKEFDFSINNEEPYFGNINASFSADKVRLDLSKVRHFPPEVDEALKQIGFPLKTIEIKKSSVKLLYNKSNKVKFDLDGTTGFGRIKLNIIANINRHNQEDIEFSKFQITISNLSREIKELLAKQQAESGVAFPMRGGSFTFDIKDMLNSQIKDEN